MADAVPMVEVWRGNVAESHHRGHAVVCDASGAVVAAWGDPDAVILPRSSCKMLQALPLVESGAADGLDTERLALACASHQGAAMHVTRVERWLTDMGFGESDLRCGPQVPDDRTERERLRANDEAPCQLHNNCSGKHAGFLMLNRRLGGGSELRRARPPGAARRPRRLRGDDRRRQPRLGHRRLLGAELRHHGSRSSPARWRAWPTRAGSGRRGEAAAGRLVAAMLAHPLLVAGEGRACSELMEAMDRKVAVKTGAEAVFAAILPERGLGVALKIEDGTTRGSESAIAAILVRLGVLDAAHPAARRRLDPPILSRRGAVTGALRPDPDFFADGKAL